MSDQQPPDGSAEIKNARRWRVSAVWLIPLGAALIGGWLLYDTLTSHGPRIQLNIDSAEGIKAGSTELKVHNVPVGKVKDVSLSDDREGARLTIQMDKDTGDLLGDDSKFWVVKPRVGPRGVSGLNTLLSGSYLEMKPSPETSNKREFDILKTPPSTRGNQSGLTLTLEDARGTSLSVGDPIIFQGHDVGQVEHSRFSPSKRRTIYSIFIKKPYSEMITGNTQFWSRSGIDLHLGAQGLDMQLGSLQSILSGGITFGQPDDLKDGPKASAHDKYTLYSSKKEAEEERYQRKIHYVVLMDDSVRGLSEGAPVEYRGLRVGTVEKVPFLPKDYDPRQFADFDIPVLIALEPQRPALEWFDWTDDEWREKQEKYFEKGLRATIGSSNLLTGSMMINLSFDKHADSYKPRHVADYPVFPSKKSQFTSIQQQVSDLMDKLNELDLDPLVEELKHTSSQTSSTMDEIHGISTKLNQMLDKSSMQNMPDQLDETLHQLQSTLEEFQEGSASQQKLNRTIDRLNQVLDNAAPLSQTLRDHPNSMIFGRPSGQDPVPRAKP